MYISSYATHLVRVRKYSAHISDNSVEDDVEPTADSIVWRIFPRLKTIAMRQVVSRLPVIERLIAILNRSEPGGYESGAEEPVEGGNRLHRICAWSSKLKKAWSVELSKWDEIGILHTFSWHD